MKKFILYILITSAIYFSNSDVNINAEKYSPKIDVIIIDAGHGGKDPGATGLNGFLEKDFNLKVAKKLKSLLEKNYNDVKVVMTRTEDRFVELQDRGKIANDAGGKLFVSIHANARENPETVKNGFELYLLNLVRLDKAQEIIQSQNIDYKNDFAGNDTLGYILSSILLNSNFKYSEKLASIFQSELSKGTILQSRGIYQKPFVVLWGAAMPSILVECGYLTDEGDLSYLESDTGQDEIAIAIYKSIRRFKFDFEFGNSFY